MTDDVSVFPDMVKNLRFRGMAVSNIHTAQFYWVGKPEEYPYELCRQRDGRLKALILRQRGRLRYDDSFNPKLIRTLELVMFPEVMP